LGLSNAPSRIDHRKGKTLKGTEPSFVDSLG
jgi:hypothetical protein